MEFLEGQAEKEMETEQQVSLIDILYKDTYRIDSFIAQLMEGIIKGKEYQENSIKEKSSLMRFSVKVASGDISSKTANNTSMKTNIEEHDYSILKLLEILDLEELSDLPIDANAQLVHLKGNIAIRNLKEFSNILPIFTKPNTLLNIDKNTADIAKKLLPLMKIIPMNIEMDLSLENNITLKGILKEEYLLSSYENIIATYGINLPHKWHVIGILDFNRNNIKSTDKAILQNLIDALATTFKQFQGGNSCYNFIPILIFRGLTK